MVFSLHLWLLWFCFFQRSLILKAAVCTCNHVMRLLVFILHPSKYSKIPKPNWKISKQKYVIHQSGVPCWQHVAGLELAFKNNCTVFPMCPSKTGEYMFHLILHILEKLQDMVNVLLILFWFSWKKFYSFWSSKIHFQVQIHFSLIDVFLSVLN